MFNYYHSQKTMDEVNACFKLSGKENVQLLSFPKASHDYDDSLIEKYNNVLKLRSDVLKAIENLRRNGVIGSAQECEVLIKINDSEVLDSIKNFSLTELNRLFIVSKASLVSTLENPDLLGDVSEVSVFKSKGTKCDRCWNFSDDVYEVDGLHLCKRCHEVVNE